ncbi:uncharacterized protein LOC141801585 isoform X1 [Halichoeres trimaculatus]|uniref:uncharacterized protein LOC141801585 isoform X1 n=1 Tax=Halichoeres trimaculatus TaxID=147232 RepID=UPI003D9F790D
MPQQFTTAAILQLVLLLSAVPAQYLISKWTSTTSAQRFHATSRLLRIWKEWRTSYLNGTAWMDWAHQQISKVTSLLGFEVEEDEAKKIAIIEAMLEDNEEGFFGASKTARSPRPPYVFLRVGDVVMERRGNMIGVVVSWDPELRAPPEWIERMYSRHEGPKMEKTPHYKVLFSGPTSSSMFVGYLPQTQLERIQGMRTSPPWRITSHTLMASVLSCSPGSERSTQRMMRKTADCSASRSFLYTYQLC